MFALGSWRTNKHLSLLAISMANYCNLLKRSHCPKTGKQSNGIRWPMNEHPVNTTNTVKAHSFSGFQTSSVKKILLTNVTSNNKWNAKITAHTLNTVGTQWMKNVACKYLLISNSKASQQATEPVTEYKQKEFGFNYFLGVHWSFWQITQ